MNSDDMLFMILVCLFAPILLAFYSGVLIKRHEKSVSAFDYLLREKYPRSYVKPNKVVKFIRKCCGIKTKKNVYWVHCIYNYLQIVMAVSPVIMIILFFFLPFEDVTFISLIIGLVPFAFIVFLDIISLFAQWHKCDKIKKSDSKYANLEYHYRGH